MQAVRKETAPTLVDFAYKITLKNCFFYLLKEKSLSESSKFVLYKLTLIWDIYNLKKLKPIKAITFTRNHSDFQEMDIQSYTNNHSTWD